MISINSELFIILFLLLSLQVFKIISLSLSINDFKANPYCLLSLSASSSDILSTSAISFVILSPPRGIEFVYKNVFWIIYNSGDYWNRVSFWLKDNKTIMFQYGRSTDTSVFNKIRITNIKGIK